MDFFQQLQERYIQEFSNTVSLSEFLVNILVAAFLATMLRLYYIYFGNAISNRRKFGQNFLPLALATLLIIMIVKSSIALSLGLVGALSIVRFRAAIKDPEELVFLFLTIGVGLACGANQPMLALIAISVILFLLWVGRFLSGENMSVGSEQLFIHIQTDLTDMTPVSTLVQTHLENVELKRMDTLESGLDMTFVANAATAEKVNDLQKDVRKLSDKTSISIIERPDLVL